jgi:hypothetical protein
MAGLGELYAWPVDPLQRQLAAGSAFTSTFDESLR